MSYRLLYFDSMGLLTAVGESIVPVLSIPDPYFFRMKTMYYLHFTGPDPLFTPC